MMNLNRIISKIGLGFAVAVLALGFSSVALADGPPDVWYSDGPSFSSYTPDTWYSDGPSFSTYSNDTWYSNGPSYSTYNDGWYSDGPSFSTYNDGWYSDGPSFSTYPDDTWYSNGPSFSTYPDYGCYDWTCDALWYPEDTGCYYDCGSDIWFPPTYGCSYDCGSYGNDFSFEWYWYEYEEPEYDYCSNIPGNQPSGYDCYPDRDYCSNIPGNQPSGYDCYPDRHDSEPVCAIDASDRTIEEGDSTTLRWTSERATSASLSGHGSVSTGGSRTVSPNNDETYTLTVRDNDGDTDTCSVTINVEEEEDHDDDEPQCELDVSDKTVEEGDRVTLEWDTENADYASINQGIGRVDEDGGTERVEIEDDTTFRMTVRDNDGDEDTCSVTVRVDEENDLSGITFYGEPTNNPPTVYLSSLPYTGLEDITPEMWAFWFTLIAGAGAVGTYFFTHGMPLAFAAAVPTVMRREDEVAQNENTLADAIASGDTEAAVELMRTAAANGTGIEEFIASARMTTSDSAVLARLDALYEAAKENGIRGAKEVLGA